MSISNLFKSVEQRIFSQSQASGQSCHGLKAIVCNLCHQKENKSVSVGSSQSF